VVKVVSLLRRADGMSKEDFAVWVVERHREVALKLPGLRRYLVSVVEGDGEFDSVNELYFDDEAARAAAFGSDAGAAAAGDAAAHTSRRVHLITTEHVQF
jgi:uncharacterized protein (TIGR02118 family)